MSTPSRSLRHVLFVAAALVAACGSNEPAAAPPAEPAPGAAPAPAAPTPPATPEPAAPAAAGPVVTDTGFELRATATGPYKAGQASSFGVALTASGGYHVNEEFPIRVTVRAPEGVTLPKGQLVRADAAEFGAERARFDVPFTPVAAGEKRVEVQVDFAVCTPENCMPDQRTLALALPVE
jgi:hypothetical protein